MYLQPVYRPYFKSNIKIYVCTFGYFYIEIKLKQLNDSMYSNLHVKDLTKRYRGYFTTKITKRIYIQFLGYFLE